VKLLRFRSEWLMPLVIVAFVGPAIRYLNVIFTSNTRWAVLAVLLLVMGMRGRLLQGLSNPFGAAVLVYLAWCAGTIMWSEAQQLSVLKVSAIGAVSIGLLAGGRAWVLRWGVRNALVYLAPLAAVALLAAILGRGGDDSTVAVSELEIYQGLSGNPNMLGSILMMSAPLLFWKVYSRWHHSRERWIWALLVATLIAFLGLANSRAAILGFACISLTFLVALPIRHRMSVIMLFVASLIALVVAMPELVEQAEFRYVYKGVDDEGVLYTRERVWEESFELAKEGGLMGAGYGVTIGGGSFQGGLSAVGYGREKGNSQLAIWEETGLVGLALYLLVLFTLFTELVKGMRSLHDVDDRMAYFLLLGGLAGILLMSVFEAWWVAPGSPEAVWFWATTGVSLEVARQLQEKARRGASAPRAHLAPSGQAAFLRHPVR
jgi:hypothetical protein